MGGTDFSPAGTAFGQSLLFCAYPPTVPPSPRKPRKGFPVSTLGKFCKNADAFYYIWGWPGPDANIYYFKDYGITWAFNKEDFRKEEVEP